MSVLYNISSSIQNGQLSRKLFIYQKKTRVLMYFLNFLWKNNLILGYFFKNRKVKIFLKYIKSKPAVKTICVISTSNKRVYLSTRQLWKLNITSKLVLISTNKGFKSLKECKNLNIAGELIAIIH